MNVNALALIVSVIALAFAAIAYWRAGGKQDVTHARADLEREFEVLRTKQRELAESAAQLIAAAYDRSRQHLAATRAQLRSLAEEAVAGLAPQVKYAQVQLEALATRLESAAKTAKDTTIATAQQVEQEIAFRVRRIKARALILRAKAKATRAVELADKRDFERADQLLDEATELVHEVREVLGDDHARDELLLKMKLSLRSASVAVRARATEARARVEFVLQDADRLVKALESDETGQEAVAA
jgi:hypothetical protein